MRRIQQQKGFTLVELAIVIVIIGLLIGGILKGQELMKNARVTATLNQISAIEAAANTFYDSRGYYPGDGVGTNQIPGCGPTDCVPDTSKVKNGTVGPANWDLKSYTTIATNSEAQETALFWYYLAATNLLSGLDGTAPTNALVFGKSAPAAKIGTGGFIVGNDNGAQPGHRTAGPNITITGTVLSLTVSPVGGLTNIDDPAVSGSMPMTPAMAAQMDRKRDDGKSSGGSMQAWGAAGCTDAAFAASSNYNEGNTAKDCGEIIGITQ